MSSQETRTPPPPPAHTILGKQNVVEVDGSDYTPGCFPTTLFPTGFPIDFPTMFPIDSRPVPNPDPSRSTKKSSIPIPSRQYMGLQLSRPIPSPR